jgi:hypothetical protein
MIKKLGIVANYQSVKDRSTLSHMEKTKKTEKYFLPKILKTN